MFFFVWLSFMCFIVDGMKKNTRKYELPNVVYFKGILCTLRARETPNQKHIRANTTPLHSNTINFIYRHRTA